MVKNASQWKVQSVRCTAFPFEDSSFDPANWWADVTGEQPDQVTTKPSEGSYLAQGDQNNGSLQLSVELVRIQWTLGPSPSQEQDDTWQVPTIGDMAQISWFVQLVKKWLAVAPPMSRLAFGTVLLDVVDEVKDGYARLDKLLPSISIDSDKMRDFLYQVNRRRGSEKSAGVDVNRLSKWSVASISPMTIQIQGGQSLVRSKAGDPVFATRLELDINNVPAAEHSFEGNAAIKLFDELVELGLEISDNGDIA